MKKYILPIVLILLLLWLAFDKVSNIGLTSEFKAKQLGSSLENKIYKNMISNFDFNFKNTPTLTLELPFSEHIEELRQRIIHIFWIILLLSLLAFIEVKFLVQILELPVNNVKFFQLSPGEYFTSTIKISFYTGILFSSPFLISQLILFLLPGLTTNEKKIILPILISSLILFLFGLLFSY